MATSRSQSRDEGGMSSLWPDVPGTFPELASAGPGSNQLSLTQAVHARRAEYVRTKTIRIKVGTWNTASFKGTEKDIGGWFVRGQGISDALTGLHVSEVGDKKAPLDASSERVESDESVEAQEARFDNSKPSLPKDDPGGVPGDEDIGLYLLGLQEIVDVTSASEAFRPYTDPEPASRWKSAVEAVLPKGYILIAEQQLIGLLLLVFASPDVAADVRSVSTTSVGTGLMGYMGNKGAVTARIVLGETTRLVFVNCHLAAGADKTSLERRNWDYGQIITRTRFEPIRDSMDLYQSQGEVIDDADFAVWAGDLNYRLSDIPGDDVRRLLMLHTRNEYDLSQPSARKIEDELAKTEPSSTKSPDRPSFDDTQSTMTQSSVDTKESSASDRSSQTSIEDLQADPSSLQTTIDSLLPHDELQGQIKDRKAFFDGWKEGPVTFLPTYKYDPGTVGVFDSSEKRRAPSWCDRILYRTRRDKLAFESLLVEEAEAKLKDDKMKQDGIDEAAKDEELLYDYDPDEDGDDDEGEQYDASEDRSEGVVVTKEGFEDEVHLEYYQAHQRVLSSDHKPLDAVFRFSYQSVIPELKAKVHQQVARELDKAENEGRPSVTVVVDRHGDEPETTDEDPMTFEGVYFGHVRYAARKHRSLMIANTGQVPAVITFVDRPVGAGQAPGPSPAWMTLNMDIEDGNNMNVRHYTGPRTLEPGDSCNVDLHLKIKDRHLITALNEGIQQLDDILVLRVENGRDHFIPVRGKWMESSLGRSIDKLIRIPEGGIRKLQNQRPKSKSSSHGPTDDMPVKWSAPRELFRLTDAAEKLTELCIAEWEMISGDEEAPWVTTAGWPFSEASWTTTTFEQRHELSAAVCEALDTNAAMNECMPPETPKMAMLETLASFLIEYLESMPDGIVTQDLWEKLQDAQKKQEREKKDFSLEDQRTSIQEILSGSPPHSISFILLTSMLDRVVQEQVASTLRSAEKDDFQIPKPIKRTNSLSKKEMSREPKIAYRQIITRKMADIFGKAVIRTPEPGKAKEKAALDDKKAKLLELFLLKDS
ncbi:Inositol polyphosphate 5-phosphatase OCRL-1 [Sphaceloma murrayae]|uniref:Inositol polyphosphate 5-phosphatase OCRL-1 n=1 Tax=Sphaceloma murrayae TaxID=2082308 RepID=A0A2K1QKR3_9PEZI|nr:Inositol polyphosphate 5-phosphatase OCRL-1 [Sphaceloma murrayae]